MSAELKLSTEPPHEFFFQSERCASRRAKELGTRNVDKETVQVERIIFLFGANNSISRRAGGKNQLSEALPLDPPRCGVREKTFLMKLGLSGTSRQHLQMVAFRNAKRQMAKAFGIGRNAAQKSWLRKSVFAFSQHRLFILHKAQAELK